MYRTPLTAADARLHAAREVVRARDELIARRDAAYVAQTRIAGELAVLEKDIAERGRGFLRIANRPRQAEDVAKHRALTAEHARLGADLVEVSGKLVGFRGALLELVAAREAKHALLAGAGAPTSDDLAAIAEELGHLDRETSALDDAIGLVVRVEEPLRTAAAILRAVDTRSRLALPPNVPSAHYLAREARIAAVALWDQLAKLRVAVSEKWLGEQFASLLAYIQVPGRVIEARATVALLLAELATHAAALHARAAEVARRVAALVTERDHLLE